VKVGSREIPIDERGRFLLNYYGPAHAFDYRSANAYLDDHENVPKLTGKIVVLGPTGFQGGVSLATRRSEDFPAVEITATAIENVIHGNFVRKPSYSALFDLFVLGLIGLFAAVVLPKVSLLYRIVILGIFLFVIVNLQFLLFASFGWLTHAFYPAIEIIFFIIVTIIIVTEGICIRLAVRLAVGLIVSFTKPGTGDHVVGAIVKGQRRVTCRERSGRGIAPVVFERFAFSSWVNVVVVCFSIVVTAGRSGAAGYKSEAGNILSPNPLSNCDSHPYRVQLCVRRWMPAHKRRCGYCKHTRSQEQQLLVLNSPFRYGGAVRT